MRGIPFCELSKTLADFYLSELKYCDAKRRWGGVELLPESCSNFWLHRFLEKAEVVLKFGISASLGEVRHFGMEGMCHCGEGEGRTWDDFHRLEDMRDYLFSLLNLSYQYYNNRSGIYNLSLPIEVDKTPTQDIEKFVLDTVEEIFASLWWDAGYGGVSWCAGVRLLKKIKYYMEKRELSNLILLMDTFINHCHNGGKFLDKFSCGSTYNIYGLLDAKYKGELTFLRFMVGADTCGNDSCFHRIWRNNHEQKEEEEETEGKGL